ncbi:isovaleryl-CoA dehydrogenase, partial [Mycobacterium tuberculosis]
MHVPTMNFDLGEEIDLLRQSVAHFASAEIAPLAAKADEE